VDVEVIQDAQTDARVLNWDNQQRQQAYKAANIRSSLIVPLFYKIERMAVLALHQFDQTAPVARPRGTVGNYGG
jgi:hypothetical protein